MKLVDIAKEMKETMKIKGHATITLYHGLRISLLERENDIVLVMERPAALVMPSELEIRIIKDAFFGDIPLREIKHPNATLVTSAGCVLFEKRKVYLAVKREDYNAKPKD